MAIRKFVLRFSKNLQCGLRLRRFWRRVLALFYLAGFSLCKVAGKKEAQHNQTFQAERPAGAAPSIPTSQSIRNWQGPPFFPATFPLFQPAWLNVPELFRFQTGCRVFLFLSIAQSDVGWPKKTPSQKTGGCAVYVRLTKLNPKGYFKSVPQKWATQNRVLHGRKAQLPVGGQPHRVPAKMITNQTAPGCHTRQARPRQGAPPFHSPYTRLQTPLPVATRYISRLSSVI